MLARVESLGSCQDIRVRVCSTFANDEPLAYERSRMQSNDFNLARLPLALRALPAPPALSLLAPAPAQPEAALIASATAAPAAKVTREQVEAKAKLALRQTPTPISPTSGTFGRSQPSFIEPRRSRPEYFDLGDDSDAEESGVDVPFHDLTDDEALPPTDYWMMSIEELMENLSQKWESPKEVQLITAALEMKSFEVPHRRLVAGLDGIELLLKVLRRHAKADEGVIEPIMSTLLNLMLLKELASMSIQAGALGVFEEHLCRPDVHKVKGLVIRALVNAKVTTAEMLSLGRQLEKVQGHADALGPLLYIWALRAKETCAKDLIRGLCPKLAAPWAARVQAVVNF